MLYQEGCPAVFQEDCGTIPGNSQRCITGYKFPRRQQRWSLRPGVTPGAGIAVVLEAWCYTRTAGAEVVHVAVTGFQGIPGGVALGTNSPDDGDGSIYTNSSKGVDTNGAPSSIPG